MQRKKALYRDVKRPGRQSGRIWAGMISLCLPFCLLSQQYTPLPLPAPIAGVNEEYSGMATWRGRLYLEPQYGDHKETMLDGEFCLYSIRTDSLSRVIDRKDQALTAYRKLRVEGLAQLPDSVKKYYEGFEAITIVEGAVFLSIETTDTYNYCFLLKGRIDTVRGVVTVDPRHFVTLKRYPYISNAGFESVTWLPQEHKLFACYEFNAMPGGGLGWLIDTSFKSPPRQVSTPFLFFRLTDITASRDGALFGINYFWNGDYNAYLNNNLQRNREADIMKEIPDLADSLRSNAAYLRGKTTCYARIVRLDHYTSPRWKQVTSFECVKNNWEGLALFRKGVLVVSDANRSSKQVTTLAYVGFE